MIVNAAVEKIGIAAFRQVEELIAVQRHFRPVDQSAEKAKFTTRQRCRHSVLVDQLALPGIQSPVAESDAFRHGRFLPGRQRLRAPEHSGDPRNQLARAERLWNVVVGTHLEPDDAIDFLAARGQQDHGYLRRVADMAAEAQAVFARHHDVEHDKIDRRAFHHLARDLRIRRRGGPVAVLAQIPRERLADIARVLDDQHMRLGFVFEHRIDPGSKMQFRTTERNADLSRSVANTGATAENCDQLRGVPTKFRDGCTLSIAVMGSATRR